MSKKQSGGIHIKADKVSIGGDVVGGNKVVTQYGMLEDEFKKIKALIEKRPDEAAVDKDELKSTLERIEAEVKKGEDANATKIERWLKFLAGMSDDIFQVTAAALTNPVAGVAKTIQLIAKKAKG
ncbi:MAG: hypothetical protein EHM81_05650 [Chloroflexi bacterium]|nr:MAG: hypothetical protein EHM81_05650 [Chloroflexota bacterium]